MNTDSPPKKRFLFWEIVLLVCASLFAIWDCLLCYSIPKFAQIFEETIGVEKNLPILSVVLLSNPLPNLFFAAGAVLVVTFFACRDPRNRRFRNLGLGICLALLVVHSTLVLLGLFLPLVVTITMM